MSDQQLRQQHQDVTDRLREQRLAVERQGAAERLLLADFYARERARQSSERSAS